MDIMVSVAMISFNHEKYIEQALESVLMQKTNFKFEIIIGDDCSTDKTQEIVSKYCNKYPGLIKGILRNKNIGALNNVYDVFTRCKGKYIAILEGDDYWTSNTKLQKQFEVLEHNPQLSAVAHKRIVVDVNNNALDNFVDKIDQNYKPIYKINDFIKQGFGFSTSTILMKNIFMGAEEIYRKVYCTSNIIGDYTLSFLLLDKGNVEILEQRLSAWRYNVSEQGSNFNSLVKRNPYKYAIDRLELLLAIKAFFGKKYNFTKEIISQVAIIIIILCKKNIFYHYKELKFLFSKISFIELYLSIIYIPIPAFKIILGKIKRLKATKN